MVITLIIWFYNTECWFYRIMTVNKSFITFAPGHAIQLMDHHTLKNVNNCLNSNIYSNLETSVGQSYNLYLNVVHFFNTIINWTSVAA
jgi:hypothetical protein